jgi:choline-sulfatase
VSNALDIPVTILDLLGIDKPSGMQGISLKPLVEGKSIEARDFLVCETEFAEGKFGRGARGRMLRTERFKYIIYDRGEKREQFFDLEADPGEMNNLAYNKNFQEQLGRHREILAQWAKETGDTSFAYYIP